MTSKLRRVWQLFTAVRARPLDKTEVIYLHTILSPGQADLFFSLVKYEQRHALNVCRTLVKAGFGADRELLQAALLHDLGKSDPDTGQYVPLWAKCVNVGLSSLGGPKLVSRLARPNPRSRGYIFYLQTEHEARSARLALKAGSSQRVVSLLAGNKTSQNRDDLAAQALQWADDLN